MKKITRILFVLFVGFSCAKKTGSAPTVNPPAQQADNIVYKDIQPDIILNSISSASLHGSGWFYVNLPVDTVCSDSLKQSDFPEFPVHLHAGNTYKWKSNSSPQANYSYFLNISSVVSLDSILTEGVFSCAKIFKSGDTIQHDSKSSNSCSINRTYSSPYNCLSPAGEGFLGFKKTRGSQVNLGWIKIERFGVNGIKVKEIAINKTNGKAIVCGQTQ